MGWRKLTDKMLRQGVRARVREYVQNMAIKRDCVELWPKNPDKEQL